MFPQIHWYQVYRQRNLIISPESGREKQVQQLEETQIVTERKQKDRNLEQEDIGQILLKKIQQSINRGCSLPIIIPIYLVY